MIFIQKSAVLFEDCKESPCFISCDYVVRGFVVFIRHIDDGTGNVHLNSFFLSFPLSLFFLLFSSLSLSFCVVVVVVVVNIRGNKC